MESTSERRPGRPPSEALRQSRREQILEAATRLFAEHGYSAANTQALADMLRVGKGTIYRYFPTKQDLFLAAVDRIMQRLNDQIDASLEGIDELFERMSRGIKAYLTYFASHPQFVELLLQERAQFKDRPKPTYFIYRDRNAARWNQEFRHLIAEGRIRDVPPERIIEVIGDLLYGTMFSNYFARRERPPEEQAEEIMDIAFLGILSDTERRRFQSRGAAAHASRGNQS
jgi:AcrR family transcriptional regulator